MDSSQRIALVTGANKGIGKEIARQLAKQGVFVLVGARDQKRGEAAEAELRSQGLPVQYLAVDITDQASVDQAAAQVSKQYGKLDILVNNAGVALDWVPPTQLDVDVLQKTFETNVFGTFRVTKAMLPLLRESKAGRIVNLSSALGSLTLASASEGPFRRGNFLLAYCSSKSAVNAITIALAKELKDAGIKVNATNPGWVATDMNGNQGTKTVEQGAATPVRLALLPDDGPTGGCFSDDGVVPW